MYDMEKHRLALPIDSEQIRCIDCGRPASYRIVHDDDREVIKQEYYCADCCS